MASLGAPVSLDELHEQAGAYEYNAHIPLRYWLRSADAMQKEAQVYEKEGNDPQTYLLLYRHALLILDKLANHPEAREDSTKKALKAAQSTVKRDLEKLEIIKPRIKRRHAQHLERQRARQQALDALEGRGDKTAVLTGEARTLSLKDSQAPIRQSYEKTALEAGENRGLAAKLAQRELQRRDAARRSVRQAGLSEEQEHERRSARIWADELDWQKPDDDELSKQIQQVAQQRDAIQNDIHTDAHMRTSSATQPRIPYNYPMVPHQTVGDHQRSSEYNSPTDEPPSLPAYFPVLPKKEPISAAFPSSAPIPPPKPPKPLQQHTMSAITPIPPPIPDKRLNSAPPVPSKLPESAHPDLEEFTFKPSAYLENGAPLRTVFLPPNLRHSFLSTASKNTALNLETCGILCGILKSNAFFISRLVIPEQISTSDTCETVNEQALFEYCDKEDLMVLGWIHTHPTQTCFMSSRDLHTHVGYQVMIPESVAIVCAPSKQPDWGIFRLTDPPGMKTVLNCRRPGLFHLHDVDDIYTGALKPGHVFELPQMPFDVVDLRPK